jgi:2-polyprenyl-3-methyl-5-hydroxy-6-metoxy-1,4-benzoquinol methylase
VPTPSHRPIFCDKLRNSMTHSNPDQLQFIDLPPDPFIRKFAAHLSLHQQVELEMLDIGCGTGRNARYLAAEGHTVFGITNDPYELRDAERYAVESGVSDNSVYIQADARNLPEFGQQFDAVIITELLHLLTKRQSTALLDFSARLVRPGGFHVVSGYVADPSVLTAHNREHCLAPDELRLAYPASAGTSKNFVLHANRQDVRVPKRY